MLSPSVLHHWSLGGSAPRVSAGTLRPVRGPALPAGLTLASCHTRDLRAAVCPADTHSFCSLRRLDLHHILGLSGVGAQLVK